MTVGKAAHGFRHGCATLLVVALCAPTHARPQETIPFPPGSEPLPPGSLQIPVPEPSRPQKKRPAPQNPPELPLPETAGIQFDRTCVAVNFDPALKGTDRFSNPKSDPQRPLQQPPYPAASRRLREEGTVVMLLLVNEEGLVKEGRVETSSGFPLLDEAALENTEHWRFLPGRQDSKPLCMWGRFSVTFYLTDELADDELEAGETAAAIVLIMMAKYVDHPVLAAPFSQESPVDREMARRVARLQLSSSNEALADMRRRVARELEKRMSEAELAHVLTFLNSTAGKKWLEVGDLAAATGARESAMQIYGRTWCAMALLRVSLGTAREASPPLLPASFDAAIPRILRDVQPFCDCVGPDLARRMFTRELKPEQIVDARDLDRAGNCPAPPTITW